MFKKMIATLGLGGTVVAVSVAAAAALDINNAPTAQATTVSVACDTDGVDVFIQNEDTDMTTRGVRIAGIDAACEGNDVRVRLLDDLGAILASGSTVVPAGGGQVTVNTSPHISIEDFEQLRIVID